MNKTNNIITLIIALIIAGCHHGSDVYKQLAAVDTLLYKNHVDSAKVVLDNVKPEIKESRQNSPKPIPQSSSAPPQAVLQICQALRA